MNNKYRNFFRLMNKIDKEKDIIIKIEDFINNLQYQRLSNKIENLKKKNGVKKNEN